MVGLFNRSVGRGLDNNADDVKVARAVTRALDGDEVSLEMLSPYMDAEIEDGIRGFQRQQGLQEDGIIHPGGETERNMIARITGEAPDAPKAEEVEIDSSVGRGGENDAPDVVTLKRALGTLGYLKFDRTKPPSPFIDEKTVDALIAFQRDRGLQQDGKADPFGPSLEELRAVLGEESVARKEDGVQVAIAPLLIPILFTLGRVAVAAAMRVGTGTALRGAAGMVGRQLAKEGTQNVLKAGAATVARLPTPAGPVLTPPTEPPDPDLTGKGTPPFPGEPPKKPEKPVEPEVVDIINNLPGEPDTPLKPEDVVEIFPNDRDKFTVPIVYERNEREQTKDLNDGVLNTSKEIGRDLSLTIKHVGGGRNGDGSDKKEVYLENAKADKTKGENPRKGSNYLYLTFEVNGSTLVHINTVDVYADGVSETTREFDAAVRVIQNKEEDDIFILVPKPRKGQTLDVEGFRDFMRQILDDRLESPPRHPEGWNQFPQPSTRHVK
jgi:peptidoglycan hydrolase-like protein with peptidoglycan-binding domain